MLPLPSLEANWLEPLSVHFVSGRAGLSTGPLMFSMFMHDFSSFSSLSSLLSLASANPSPASCGCPFNLSFSSAELRSSITCLSTGSTPTPSYLSILIRVRDPETRQRTFPPQPSSNSSKAPSPIEFRHRQLPLFSRLSLETVGGCTSVTRFEHRGT
jgi:hypothetical protein